MVVKDHHEFKLLLNEHVLTYLDKKFLVKVILPSVDSEFKEIVEAKYDNVSIFAEWPKPASTILKVYYWAVLQLHYLANADKSESCLQKSIINFISSAGFLTNRKGAGISFANRVTSSSIKRLAWLVFGRFLILPLLMIRYISGMGIARRVEEEAEFFDYIVFGRPNSTDNVYFFNRFNGRKAKVVTLCRNLDTPTLKGPFTVNSDLTISFDSIITDDIKSLLDRDNYGRVLQLASPIKLFKKDVAEKMTDAPVNVLFASSDPWLSPNDPLAFGKLLSELKQRYGSNFNLTLRLVHSDKLDRYLGTDIESEFVKVDLSLMSEYNKQKGNVFEARNDASEFYSMLQQYDYVFSSSSTINYEAVLLGINTAYLSFGEEMELIDKRDHLAALRHKYNIPLIKDDNNLSQYFQK